MKAFVLINVNVHMVDVMNEDAKLAQAVGEHISECSFTC